MSNNHFHWRPHPWHGLSIGPDAPNVVHAFIEITPFDIIKYEIDKTTGYMRVDRPQRSSSLPPSLYGFVPRTYCGKRVGELSSETDIGDRDPLDICVLSERPISKSEVILNARIIGGIHMVDKGEADDKLIGVLDNDTVWGDTDEIDQLPEAMVDRLRHYFSTYKQVGADSPDDIYVTDTYDRAHAYKVLEASIKDYCDEFPDNC